ncbi:MAG: hypothetical protein QXQ14_01375 [Candidatus Aenigmatarchaeota archaeon]
MELKELISKIKGKNRLEFLENISILFIFLGAILISLALFLNAFGIKYFDAILAMSGSLIIFIFLFLLIIVIFIKE